MHKIKSIGTKALLVIENDIANCLPNQISRKKKKRQPKRGSDLNINFHKKFYLSESERK